MKFAQNGESTQTEESSKVDSLGMGPGEMREGV
jgi:hypothetical protein